MSLINDMLRDLEKREQQQNASAHESTPAVIVERNPRKIVMVLGVIFLLIVFIWLGIGMKQSGPPIPVPPVSEHEKVGARETTVDRAPVPVDRVVVVPDNRSPAVPVLITPQPEVISASNVPEELSSLSITTTDKQTVLSLSLTQLPHYQLVEGGAGEGSLVVLIDDIQLGAEFVIPSTVSSLIERLSLVPQKETLRLLIDLVPGARIQSSQLIETSQQGFRLQIVFVLSDLEKEPVKMDAAVASTTQQLEKIPEKETPAIAKTRKQAPVVARDKQAYRAGLEQLRAGRAGAAEASFVQALLVNPEFLEARLQLISLLQQQKKFVKAEEFLQRGLSLTPDSSVLRKIYARQLLREQRGHKAIELLQTVPVPQMAHDLEYHALLAAALQRAGEYRSASSIYAQLVKIRPKEALWWLGMAVSLEQSGHREASRHAYQKALNLPGLRPDLQSYVQGRLQAL